MDCKIFNVRTDVNAYGLHAGVYGRLKSWNWEKKNLPHRGIEPAYAACRSDALSTELHPRPSGEQEYEKGESCSSQGVTECAKGPASL